MSKFTSLDKSEIRFCKENRLLNNLDKIGDRNLGNQYSRIIKPNKDYFGAEFRRPEENKNYSGHIEQRCDSNNYCTIIGGKKVRLF